MLKRVTIGLAAALSALVPPFASAQTVPKGVFTPEMQHRPSNQSLQTEFDNRKLRSQMSDAEIAYAGAATIASCLVRRGRDQAGSFLGGTLMGDPNYTHIGEALTKRYSNCATNSAASTASAISGVLAEQLLVKQAPTLEDRATGVSEADAHAFFGDLNGVVTFDNVAGCLAVYSPGLVYKLVRTDIGSNEQTAALQALYKGSPECRMSAPPEQINPAEQRATLATALYKWTHRQA
jgi:hypothetical protein